MVYLFKEDMSGFYLSLNQGYTYFRDKYGAKEGRLKVQETVRLIHSKVDVSDEYKIRNIDLGSTRDLAIGYEKGHIYGKYYDAINIPSDAELISDFRELIEAYKKIVLFMNGRNVKEFNDYLLLQDDLEYLEIDEEEGARPPKGTVIDEGGKERYPRNAKEAAKALLRANYTCEVDPNHKTFISKSTGNKYGEAHHFVGISHHEKFPEVDLDRASNIVCLCPSCHRKIHHAVDEVRLPMIGKIFDLIKVRLDKVGIEVTITQLKEFYGIRRK
jgi:5-methylcytosine-specific restriction enzyme A